MIVDIDPLEGLWLTLNGSALALTVLALREAIRDRRAVAALNGLAREVAATSMVRRELVRLVTQVLLIGAVVPSIFTARPITLSLPVVLLMLAAGTIFVNTALDARDRRKLLASLLAEFRRTHGPAPRE